MSLCQHVVAIHELPLHCITTTLLPEFFKKLNCYEFGKADHLTSKTRIFISSVQKELADERRALKEFASGDPLLSRFFEVFLFEDLPASDRRADEVYLNEVDRCGIYSS